MGQTVVSGFPNATVHVGVPPPAPPWWSSLLPSAPSLIVAVAGFWIVHRLSVERQKRDETFKLAQAARDLAAEAAALAVAVWEMPASNKKRAGEVNAVIGKFGRLGRYLEMLRARAKSFDVQTELKELRLAATRDIEDPAPNDLARREAIRAAADRLEEAIDRAFLSNYR